MNQKNKIGKAILLCLLVISLSIVVEADSKNYNVSYDKNGNLNQGFDEFLEYNEFNQLVRVRQNNSLGDIIEEYNYDQDGERIKKYEPLINQTTYYISDNYIEIVNSTGTYKEVYYYEGDVLVGRKDSDGRKFFNHPDHLGSTNIVTNENGVLVEESTYKPYGSIIDDGFSRFLFTGKELDDNTGMYYYGARYYDPFFRHFTQPDLNIPDLYNPQDLNRYSYVRNNPYKYVDPTGDIPVDVVVDVAFIAYGAYQFAKDPSLKNLASLGVDIGFAFLPYAINPKVLKVGKQLAKGLGKADDLKSFTKSNFRENVGKLTGGQLSKSEEAHHIFPQSKEFRDYFEKAGINIHDPQYGARVDKGLHRSFSYEYNKEFKKFFSDPYTDKSKEGILKFGQNQAKKYNFKTNINKKSAKANLNSKSKGKKK